MLLSRTLTLLLWGFATTLIAQSLPAPAAAALRTAAARQQLVLTEADYLLRDHYVDAKTGIAHYYLQQQIDGRPVHGAHAGLHLTPAGQAVGTTLQFLPRAAARLAGGPVALTARQALARAAGTDERAITDHVGPGRYTWLAAPGELRQPARVELMYYPVGRTLVAAYEVILDSERTGLQAVYVSARNASVLARRNLTVSCAHGPATTGAHHTAETVAVPAAAATLTPQYEVIALPLASPSYGTRSVAVNPATLNPAASPSGWHTTAADGLSLYTRGNNVDCYLDTAYVNQAVNGDADRAFGGAALDFSFPYVPNTDPGLYDKAALTNAFYGINVAHDILYNYGFDRPAGNFEANDGDAVRAEVQDGPAGCNANFGTPPDGMQPRTQTYLCGNRDLAFDNGITFHEFGHGVSNRLTGGPSTATCLFNDEQMGEGWSDFLALVLTMQASDTPTTNRTIANWLRGQGPTGGGIRPTPYTTDQSVNPTTYGQLPSLPGVHRLGYAWCTVLWDLTWAFVDQYGFDADVYNGTGGNNRVLQLVMTGMKMQACSPGFVDGRDALLAADQALYGGTNQALIWTVFANRGLGYSAAQGSSLDRNDQVEAFDLPPAYGLATTVTADRSTAAPGDEVTFVVSLENNSTQTFTGLEVRCPIPPFTTPVLTAGSVQGAEVIFAGGSLAPGATTEFQFTVSVNANAPLNPADLLDDFETSSTNWSSTSQPVGSYSWLRQNGAGYQGSTGIVGPADSSRLSLTLTQNAAFGVGEATELRFRHQLLSETNFDGGYLEITTDGGRRWTNLTDHFTQGGYNGYINFNPANAAFSGDTGGFSEAVVSLASFAGQSARLRFVMYSDFGATVPNGGWTLDDIALANRLLVLPLEATVTSAQGADTRGALALPVRVVAQALPVTLTQFGGTHRAGRGNHLTWTTATERQSSHFVLEHRAASGAFRPLATLPAAGHSAAPRHYAYTHAGPAPGGHYYRLRQLDLDGSETLSHTVVVQAPGQRPVQLLPNPTRGTVQLLLPATTGAGTTLEVYDLRGQLVYRRTGLQAGTQRLDLSALPDGMYAVRIPALQFTERLLLAH